MRTFEPECDIIEYGHSDNSATVYREWDVQVNSGERGRFRGGSSDQAKGSERELKRQTQEIREG